MPQDILAFHPRTPQQHAAPPAVTLEEEDSDGLIVEYWRTLARHRRTITLASAVGLVLGFVVGIPMAPVFRAETTLEVLTLNGDFMNLKQSNPTTPAADSYETSEEETQAKLLQSRFLLSRVIEKLDPAGAEASAKHRALATSGWRSWLHLPERSAASTRQTLLNKAAATLKVKPIAHTRVLEATVESTDPQMASDFANTLAREFVSQNIESRWANTQTTSEWLKGELDEARTKLRSSEDALQRYAASSGLIFTDEATNVATERLQQLQQSLSAATADRIAKQSRYELAQKASPDTLGDVLNDGALRDTLAKINDTKRELAEVATAFQPESSKIQRPQAKLLSLQAAFNRQRSDIVTHIHNDYIESARKENLLNAAFKKQSLEVTGQDKKAIQYNILKRDVDSNRQLYDTMLQQMKQASITSAIRAGNIRVVDPATIPVLPVTPNFPLNSALGLIAGLLGSISLVTLRERADRTIQKPGEIRLWADIAELGVIPSALRFDAGKLHWPQPSLTGRRVPALPAAPHAIELATAQERSSITAEAFRSALTSLLFVAETPQVQPKVLVFTSANAADGKTTVASNIAIAAAEIRMKVLIIDADLRRPRMHDIFKLHNGCGLADILNGGLSYESANQIIQPTVISNLSVLPAGTPTDAAAHLLYSAAWPALLESLRPAYDLILIDTPPMLQMTDARVAARHADAVVLVARSTLTTRDAVIAAKERLTEDRLPVVGAILNDWDPESSPGGYYGYYRANYYNSDYFNGKSYVEL